MQYSPRPMPGSACYAVCSWSVQAGEWRPRLQALQRSFSLRASLPRGVVERQLVYGMAWLYGQLIQRQLSSANKLPDRRYCLMPKKPRSAEGSSSWVREPQSVRVAICGDAVGNVQMFAPRQAARTASLPIWHGMSRPGRCHRVFVVVLRNADWRPRDKDEPKAYSTPSCP